MVKFRHGSGLRLMGDVECRWGTGSQTQKAYTQTRVNKMAKSTMGNGFGNTVKLMAVAAVLAMMCGTATAQGYTSMRAAHEAAAKTEDPKERDAAYQWGKKRLETSPKEYQDFNYVAKMADLAGKTDEFGTFCIAKSEDKDINIATSVALYFADAYANKGDMKNAEVWCRKVMSFGNDCPALQFQGAVSRLAPILAARGDKKNAIAAYVALLNHPSASSSRIAQKIILLQPSNEELAGCAGILSVKMAVPPVDAQEFLIRAEKLSPEIVELFLAAGINYKAVRESKAMLLLASDKFYPQAVENTARCLKRIDGNLGRANDFLTFQSADVTNAPPSIPNPMYVDDQKPAPCGVRDEAYAALANSPVPADWNQWLTRYYYLLWLERPAEALDAALEAFKACPLNEESLQKCAAAVVRPYLVITRDNATARTALDYLLYGANGKDGIAIPDPFPAIRAKLGN